MRRYVFISCWSLGDVESAALWKMYTAGNEAVAIKSTVGGLLRALSDSAHAIRLGRVKYVDFRSHRVDPWNFMWPYFSLKRQSFAFESEVRAMFLDIPQSETGWGPEYDPDPSSAGKTVSVRVDELVTEVRIAPDGSDWLMDATKSIVTAFLPDHVGVRRSSLDEDPLP
jgi:hypothetical protein